MEASIRLLVLCFILTCSFLITCDSKKTKKLKITTESKPSDCLTVAETGDTLVVHYTGSLETGQVFDSSRERDPFPVQLGAGQVIQGILFVLANGWDEGLVGMCQGEVRKLVIPPHLAYGDRGAGDIIPAGATLIFSVELMELRKKPLIKLPGSQFWTYLGIGAVVMLILYELYRRVVTKEEKKSSSKRKGSKKRK